MYVYVIHICVGAGTTWEQSNGSFNVVRGRGWAFDSFGREYRIFFDRQ